MGKITKKGKGGMEGYGRRNSRKGATVGSRNELEEAIYERFSINVAASGAGAFSGGLVNVQPANVFSAARLAGYQAIRDDARIDHVRVTFIPAFEGTSSGRVALYLERDPTEPISASFDLASDQLESSKGTLTTKLVLDWFPQQPSDYAFQPLNPGTVSFAEFNMVADNLSSNGVVVALSTVIGTCYVESWLTLRGRPN